MVNNDGLIADALFSWYLRDGLSVCTRDELVLILLIIQPKRKKWFETFMNSGIKDSLLPSATSKVLQDSGGLAVLLVHS